MIVLSHERIDSPSLLCLPNARADDHHLALRIMSALIRHMPTTGQQLQVAINAQGALVLAGSVRTFYAKQLAYHACQRLAEGRAVVDSLVVDDRTAAPCWQRR